MVFGDPRARGGAVSGGRGGMKLGRLADKALEALIGAIVIGVAGSVWAWITNRPSAEIALVGVGLFALALLTAMLLALREIPASPTAAPDEKSLAHRQIEVQFLVNLKETATHVIINRFILAPNPGDVERLRENFEWWDKEVQAALESEGATASEKLRFRTLVAVPALFSQHGPASKIMNETAEKIARLDAIIERMS